jgi:glutathione-independent formaldehyde dehydrogenase
MQNSTRSPTFTRVTAAVARQGAIAFDFGEFWGRGQRMGTGQAPMNAYNRHLCNLVHEGKAEPSFIVSRELSLDEAP